MDKAEKNKKERERYKKRINKKICHICSTEFLGTDKQKTCSKVCTKNSKLHGMAKCYHIKICKYCSNEIYRKEKFGTLGKEKIIHGVCVKCSENRKKLRDSGRLYYKPKTNRKKGINNSPKKKFNNEEYKKYLSEVGLRLNTVKIKEKSLSTLIKRIKSGEIKFKKETNIIYGKEIEIIIIILEADY